jgi:hypothetical protein
MNDFFTRSFINFNKFEYDNSIERIDPKDIMQMNSIYKKTLFVTVLMPLSGFILIKMKSRMFSFILKKLEQNGNAIDNSFSLKHLIRNSEDKTSLEKIQNNSDAFKYNQIVEESTFSERIKVESPSRTIYKRNNSTSSNNTDIKEFKDKVINHNNSWYNMKEITFLKNFNESNLNSVKKTSKFNEYFKNSGIKYMMKFIKSTIIFLPFIVILFKIWYDFLYFNLSMYFKYKPLVDSYYKKKLLGKYDH